jgi:type I restriction enzyme S subunit
MEHVEAHTMRLLGSVPANTMKSSSASFGPTDVLYGRLRPYLNKVVQPGIKGLCSAEFIVFPDTGHLRSAFLKYRMNAADFVSFASHQDEGDRPRVDFTQLGRFPVWLPPEPEQRRIVQKIEELFSQLDAGVAALERVKANLKRYRAAVLKAAVEGKLTAEWRAKHADTEPASKLLEHILKERRRKWEEAQLAKYAAVGKDPPKGWREKYREPDGIDRKGGPGLPRGWCWASLRAIAELVGGITKGQRRHPSEVVRSVPYLRVANVQRGFFDLAQVKCIDATEHEIADLRLARGDVLFTEGGDRDKLGRGWVWDEQIEECIHQNHIFRARLYSLNVQPRFVSHYGNSVAQRYFVGEGVQTTNLASINLQKLGSLSIPLPAAEEQEQIVAEVERRLSIVDELEGQVEADLKRAGRLRQSILKRAFAGHLAPQDPADEPASKLLERIRAERGRATAGSRAKAASADVERSSLGSKPVG